MAFYLITDEQGAEVNRIVAEEAFVEANYPGRWELLPEPEPIAPAVPLSVSRAQGKVALIHAGLWDAALTYVAGIKDPAKRAYADVALNDTQEWRRDSQFLSEAAVAMGLTSAQLDELFVLASTVAL